MIARTVLLESGQKPFRICIGRCGPIKVPASSLHANRRAVFSGQTFPSSPVIPTCGAIFRQVQAPNSGPPLHLLPSLVCSFRRNRLLARPHLSRVWKSPTFSLVFAKSFSSVRGTCARSSYRQEEDLMEKPDPVSSDREKREKKEERIERRLKVPLDASQSCLEKDI